MICPNYKIKEVFDGFNEIVEALGGKPLTEEEFRSSELRNQRTGVDYSAMEATYKIYHRNNGNMIDSAPNGKHSILFDSLLEYFNGDRLKAIKAKSNVYSDEFFKWFGDWTVENKENPYFSDILIDEAFPDYDSADMNGAGAMFAIRKNGEYIGSIAVNAYYRKGNKIEPWGEKGTNRVSMSSVGDSVEIEKEFRGKGYGKAAYFEFAKKMANMGYVLTSAPTSSRTEASTRVWKSLVRDGYAKEIGDRYEFINSVINNVSKVVDDNGEPLVVYHGSDNYGFEEFDPSKSDDKMSIFTSSSEFIASTYTKHIPLHSEFLRLFLLKNGAIDLIKNKQFDKLLDLIRSLYDHRLNPNDLLEYDTAMMYDELKDNALSEEDRSAILSEISRIEEIRKKHYHARIKDVKKIYGNTEKNIRIFDDLIESYSHFIDESLIFDGSPEDLTDSILNKSKVYCLFENIKNPLYVTNLENEFGAALYWNTLDFTVTDKEGNEIYLHKTRDISKWAKDNGYDGVIFESIVDHGGYSGDNKISPVTDQDILYSTVHEGEDSYHGGDVYMSDVYISFSPNQIKHVENLGTFSPEDDNMYQSPSEINEFQSQYAEAERLVYEWNKDNILNGWHNVDDSEKAKYRKQRKEEFKNKFNYLAVNFGYDRKSDRAYMYIKDETQDSVDKWKEFIEGGADINKILDRLQDLTVGYNLIIRLLRQAFRHKNIRFEFGEYDRVIGAMYSHSNHTVYINTDTAYRNQNKFADQFAQTLLHELIHAVTVETIHNSPELYNQCMKLIKEVKKLFPEYEYGLSDPYEFIAELSNKEFVNKLLQVRTESKEKKLLSQKSLFTKIYDFVVLVCNDVLRFANFKKNKGTAYADALEILVKATFPDNFNVLRWQHKWEEGEDQFYSTSSTDHIRKSAEDIRNRFGVLYKAYEKMPNKSPRRLKQANEIFELHSKLKLINDFEAVTNALKFAMKKLGLNDDSNINPGVKQWLEQNTTDNFARVSAEQIVDLMLNTIGFFDNLVTYFPDNSYMTDEAINMRKTVVDGINLVIKPLWAKAVYTIGDRIVDELVDRWFTGQDEDAEGMKEVAKDWLHKNSMYGDVSSMAAFLLNYQYSDNPITKLVFHLILVADTKTGMELLPISARISKAYLKANKEFGKLNPSWLKIFMEFDENGIPTGNFVRDINYGQYLKDVDNFVSDLNKRFQDKYGHFYYVDESGAYINSITGGLADDEEWINGNQPHIIEYLLEIELYKCERANRRYTFDYYKERMSEPYTGPDPAISRVGKNYKHGLSPRTLSKYNRIQSNINYYMSLCYDKETGVSHPEDLSDDDWMKLELFRMELQTLSNPYNEDGSVKSGEDYQTAIEIRAWEKWIGEKLDSKVDMNSFNAEANKILVEKGATAYDRFIKYNSKVGINPNFISQTIKKYGVSDAYAEAIHAKLLRTSLQKLVDSKKGYGRDLARQLNNPQFWQECKRVDLVIEDNKTKQGKDFAEMMEQNFDDDLIEYRDMYGNAYDYRGTIVPRDKEKDTTLLTWHDWIINKYTSDIVASPNRTKDGLYDATGNLHVFTGTEAEVKALVRMLFTYRHMHTDADGTVKIERRPLSIFSILTPLNDTFVNDTTGQVEPTITNVPSGRFLTKIDTTHKYLTDPSEYDYNSLIAEQPKRKYYDNSENFNKIKGSAKDLYDTLVDVCRNTQSIYKLNSSLFNYRLPMINAQSMALLSRLKSDGFANVSRAIFDAITTVEENDENMRTAELFATNPDGTVCTDIPLKFVRPLKDMSRLSTDISSMVVLFAEMGLNFKNKLKIDSTIKALRYNMDYNNRELLKTEDDITPREGKHATELFDNMTNIHLYGNDWHFKTNKDEPYGRSIIGAQKVSKFLQRYETKHMLGLNILSMLVGACDAGVKLVREVLNGKYARPADMIKGLIRCILNTPRVIANIGCPLANNKLTALMQLFRISKGTRATFEHMNWGRIHKVAAQFLMGGFSMLDYMMNGLLLMTHMSNVRLYNEDGSDPDIKPGFYTLYELQQAFIKAGRKKSEATFKHLMLKTDLYNAFDFSSEEGCCYINDKYKDYITDDISTMIITKTLSRGALYNGMNPDNDQPEARKRVWSAITLAMRGWLTQAYQHLMSGGIDNIPIHKIKEEDFDVRYGKTHKTTEYKKQKLTNELKARRLSWNYETGTPQDLIFVGIYRSFGTLYKYAITNAFRNIPDGDPKKVKFSNVEKYAWTDALIYLASMAIMMTGWMFMNDSAGDVPPPDKDDPKFLTDPISYITDVYIPNQYWKLQFCDIYFRTIESSISSVDPTTAYDFITSLTVLKSGFDEQIGLIAAGSDITGLSGKDVNEILNRGGYKGYTRLQRAFFKGTGFLDNIHTFFDFYGLDSNINFYTGKYGRLYRFFGYDYKRDYGRSKKKVPSEFDYGESFNYDNFNYGESFDYE